MHTQFSTPTFKQMLSVYAVNYIYIIHIALLQDSTLKAEIQHYSGRIYVAFQYMFLISDASFSKIKSKAFNVTQSKYYIHH